MQMVFDQNGCLTKNKKLNRQENNASVFFFGYLVFSFSLEMKFLMHVNKVHVVKRKKW